MNNSQRNLKKVNAVTLTKKHLYQKTENTTYTPYDLTENLLYKFKEFS